MEMVKCLSPTLYQLPAIGSHLIKWHLAEETLFSFHAETLPQCALTAVEENCHGLRKQWSYFPN